MRPTFLDICRCPACGCALTLGDVFDGDDTRVERGRIDCGGCHRTFVIEHGMPHLHRDDDTWTSKAREARGWVAHQAEHGYTPEADFVLPYGDAPIWRYTARAFDVALERARLDVGTRVLDLGAGRGWAAKHLALRGARAVAIDVCGDEDIGLGRAGAVMARAGVHFDCVVGDGEHLPFDDGVFGAVWVSAALHHASDLDRLVSEAARVLEPGGTVVVGAEPVRALDHDELAVLAEVADDEIRFGITERRPTIVEYVETFAANGLRVRSLHSHAHRQGDRAELAATARRLGLWPTVQPRRPRSSVLGLGRWARRAAGRPAATLAMLRHAARIDRHRPGFRELNVLMWLESDFGMVATKDGP